MNAKTKTANGKQVAPYTLLCEFLPQYQRVNPTTGEVFQRFTYRCDIENKKYAAAHNGDCFENDKDALAYVYNTHGHKCHRVRLYDNSRGKLLAEWNRGKLIYPIHINEKMAINNWLRSI
ncbi:MAG TPA: hypothetical protein PKM40_03010 [Bacteroidia bacterium]|nr:hypothetical protein [Bacteroidia bacterium]